MLSHAAAPALVRNDVVGHLYHAPSEEVPSLVAAGSELADVAKAAPSHDAIIKGLCDAYLTRQEDPECVSCRLSPSDLPIYLQPQRDSNPCFHLERVVS